VIKNETAIASESLARFAVSKGLTLTTSPGSPLSDLVNTTNKSVALFPDLLISSKASDDLSNHSLALSEGTKSRNPELVSPHDTSLDAYVKTISLAVCDHISFAKNITRPLVLDLIDKVKSAIVTPVLPESEFEIKVKELPVPMRNAGFQDSIYKEKPVIVFVPEKYFYLEEKTTEEIIELMMTGSKAYDSDLIEWVTNLPQNLITETWSSYFCNKKGQSISFTPSLEIDAALIIYLLSRKLINDVPEDSKVSLEEFKITCGQHRDWCKDILSNEFHRYNAGIRNKVLVSKISYDRKELIVNGVVYRDWLNTGGSNEILLGLLVSDDKELYVHQIDAKALEYKQKWISYINYKHSISKNEAYNRFKETLIFCFGSQLKDKTQEEISFFDESPEALDSIEELLIEEISKLTMQDMENINDVCLRLVADVRFFYTGSGKILRGINEAVRINPNIDIREAALLSSIEYVTDFVGDQIIARVI
jgi:hypothetical protein